jgi:NADPH2:quinone reductase
LANKYQVKPPLPFSPGCDAAGVIAGIGEGVTGFRPGDRVMAIAGDGAFALISSRAVLGKVVLTC